jgi:hypothetical protein
MKQNNILVMITLVLVLLFGSNLTRSQDKKPDMEAAMKKWMEASTPGDAHKKLNDLVGSWNIATTMWMEGPDKPPATSKGTAELKWALNGRFLQQNMNGEMMGMPMNGVGFNGYDNIDKKYTMFWIDNTSTAMFTAEGGFDKTGTVLTMYGKMDDLMTGEHDKNAGYIIRFIDKDKWIFEFLDPAMQPNTKIGEIVYTRKK